LFDNAKVMGGAARTLHSGGGIELFILSGKPV